MVPFLVPCVCWHRYKVGSMCRRRHEPVLPSSHGMHSARHLYSSDLFPRRMLANSISCPAVSQAGKIPAELGKLAVLEDLNLGNNRLTGECSQYSTNASPDRCAVSISCKSGEEARCDPFSCPILVLVPVSPRSVIESNQGLVCDDPIVLNCSRECPVFCLGFCLSRRRL